MIKERVFDITGFSFEGKIDEISFDGVYVHRSGSEAVIGYNTKAQKARCFFMLSKLCSEGKESFEIKERPVFDLCGPMLDLSRGGVMRKDAVKRYIDRTAALGFNMLMLYTEDIYEMKEYPMFGYLRGRYSEADLKEMDDYAFEMGVELIPCIQTLGHLANYIKWGEAAEFAENSSVLLVDEEKTYKFIETEIKTMRKCLRSNKIHIGMDEAVGLGCGKYLEKHGIHNKLDIFNRHLKRVLDITKKYNYSPMIWGDMYFSEINGNYYYEPDAVIPDKAIADAPEEPELVFWDYYHTYYDYYDTKLAQYARFPNTSSFAGGVWTMAGFAPNFRYTYDSMIPALQCCVDRGVKTVIATMWADGGCETDFFDAFDGLAVFSEYCYKGKECTEEDIYSVAAHITNSGADFIDAVASFHFGLKGPEGLGKGLVYCDPIINLLCYDFDYDRVAEVCEKAINTFDKYRSHPRYTYYNSLFNIILKKAELLDRLQKEYKADNREYLNETAEKAIPELQKLYKQFYAAFSENWLAVNKPFGYEVFAQRFGGIEFRLVYTQEQLRKYCAGEIERIEELDEEIITGLNKPWRYANSYMNTNG
ncbi:MAG: family 20 glycosylhydrolase [Clostridia bacterium]|nr:family 20 glycosylhydrolase [Clostridia bacterium]